MSPKPMHTPGPARARCPVCREVVYSRAGIHPQCAVRQSEAPRAKPRGPEAGDPPAASAVDSAMAE
jgi:hypothetical protein